MAYRGFRAGGFGLHLSIDDRLTNRIRDSRLYRMIRPKNGADATNSPSKVRLSSQLERGGVSKEAAARNPELAAAVGAIDWYHTIDLGDGIVTPGAFDHRPVMQSYPLPRRLDGLRVLDVATFDGYWAFEFERRGAAEVVALDIEKVADLDLAPAVRALLPREELERRTGLGFALAKERLGSKVKREVLSIYDLSPQKLGTFDLVFCSDLLLHLNSPVRALQKLRSVTGGMALLTEPFNPSLPPRTTAYCGGQDHTVWWSFSAECLRQLIVDAGFDGVELASRFKLGHRWEAPWMWHAAFRARVGSFGRLN